MCKRYARQMSFLETPVMFGKIPLDPKNEWVKLSKMVPWVEFEDKYAEKFKSKKRTACVFGVNGVRFAAHQRTEQVLRRRRNRASEDKSVFSILHRAS